MHKEKLKALETELQPEVLEVLKEKVFHTHTIDDASVDLDKLFFSYVCDENVDDAYDRQSAAVTYMLLKKLLTCLSKKQDPDRVNQFEVSLIL